MKCSESWLREWVNPAINRDQLCTKLTMSGFEVEELVPAAKTFSGIVVGQILKIDKHPEADRLHLCEVNIGKEQHLKIVCGAENVRVGMKVPVAMIGAIMPDQTEIKASNIRNIASQGMLCSATELGFTEESRGLLELSADAPIGEELIHYLNLDDYVIDISITPNRGDCLSIRGMAREVSALTQSPLKPINISEVNPHFNTTFTVNIEAKKDCPHYVGRVIRNVKADSATPVWLKERLRRSGIRSISAIVDVTNYVMLELGQPMHAFDLNHVKDKICVRQSKVGERIVLLDGCEQQLESDTLVIADAEKPLAIAGVMGGMDSSVTTLTQHIFLESAFFPAQTIAKQRQRYGLNSDSSYRFERGVDYTIQREAIERASKLIMDIAGGEAGPVIEVTHQDALPAPISINLDSERITKVLGITLPDQEIETHFKALNFSFKHDKNQWKVNIPTYRFDITIPEDLIEEIARLHGYDKIPTHTLKGNLRVTQAAESAKGWLSLKHVLRDAGYHEVITYSFVDSELQKTFDSHNKPYPIVNPITGDMNVMRSNLWPGLVKTLLYNQSRQQHRIRLFEIGTCFVQDEDVLLQQAKLGGLISGLSAPEQWGLAPKEVDFYDLKGDIERLLAPIAVNGGLIFKPETHSCLHPGQTAVIYNQDKKLGIMGALHPSIQQSLDITHKVFVYELDLSSLEMAGLHPFQEISKFPEIRRDIAIVVNQAIPARDIQDTIKVIAGDWLKDVFIFDVYQGKGISPGLKSIALALIWQHATRTLVDDEVTALMEQVIAALKGKLGAELRR